MRASVVMGFVGAGGLGQLMDQSMKMLNGGEASTILLVFLPLVLLADALSARHPARAAHELRRRDRRAAAGAARAVLGLHRASRSPCSPRSSRASPTSRSTSARCSAASRCA